MKWPTTPSDPRVSTIVCAIVIFVGVYINDMFVMAVSAFFTGMSCWRWIEEIEPSAAPTPKDQST
jgi:hypothetical protein